MMDRVPEELWTEVCDTAKEADDQGNPKEKEMKKSKMAALRGLKNR